jgi:hypothetical protein
MKKTRTSFNCILDLSHSAIRREGVSVAPLSHTINVLECRTRSGVRGFRANAILDGEHDEVIFSDRIDNPIIAFANPIEVIFAHELRDVRGARIATECLESFNEKFPKRFGECVEVLLSRKGYENCGDYLVQSESQFFQNDIK